MTKNQFQIMIDDLNKMHFSWQETALSGILDVQFPFLNWLMTTLSKTLLQWTKADRRRMFNLQQILHINRDNVRQSRWRVNICKLQLQNMT